MPVIQKLLTDESHTFDSTYMFSMRDCECKDCEFGCSDWADVPAKLKGLLCCKPVLPMLNADEPGHMLQYDAAEALAGGTSERDLPSKKDVPDAEMQRRLKKDKEKDLHPSKVCHIRKGYRPPTSPSAAASFSLDTGSCRRRWEGGTAA